MDRREQNCDALLCIFYLFHFCSHQYMLYDHMNSQNIFNVNVKISSISEEKLADFNVNQAISFSFHLRRNSLCPFFVSNVYIFHFLGVWNVFHVRFTIFINNYENEKVWKLFKVSAPYQNFYSIQNCLNLFRLYILV